MKTDLQFKRVNLKHDFALVRELFEACNDYVIFEQGKPADDAYVTAFFKDSPVRPDFKQTIAVFDGDSNPIGTVDLVEGYPAMFDWYLGLLLLTPQARSCGLGPEILHWVIETAKAGSAKRLLLRVAEGNSAGKRFWEREGFVSLRQMDPSKFAKVKHVKIEMCLQL